MNTEYPPVWIIAGPTASGKSALALSLAKKYKGTIINADSMQVYRETPIIGSQPTKEEQALIPHVLYSTISVSDHMSAAQWAQDAVRAIHAAYKNKSQPILVGGSGLYLKALTEGFSAMPDVPSSIRQQVTNLYDMLGPQEFHLALAAIDPESAKRLHATDRQRCIRAREIYEASHQTLTYWQSQKKEPVGHAFTYRFLTLLPDRDWLYERINHRFELFVAQGAIEEARHVLSMNLDSSLTGMQALGLQALCSYLEDRLNLLEAIEIGQTQSRQYAKRQYTWFKGQQPTHLMPCKIMTQIDDIAQAEYFLCSAT
jgi:tRNA dimethylallyltransferase